MELCPAALAQEPTLYGWPGFGASVAAVARKTISRFVKERFPGSERTLRRDSAGCLQTSFFHGGKRRRQAQRRARSPADASVHKSRRLQNSLRDRFHRVRPDAPIRFGESSRRRKPDVVARGESLCGAAFAPRNSALPRAL